MDFRLKWETVKTQIKSLDLFRFDKSIYLKYHFWLLHQSNTFWLLHLWNTNSQYNRLYNGYTWSNMKLTKTGSVVMHKNKNNKNNEEEWII